MESLALGQMDDFFLRNTMYGDSDSEEEIVCTSCSRGRLRQSVFMPRLPHYKIVHQKKVDFKAELGLAENGMRPRVLGRGRAKCKQRSTPVPPPGKFGDSASESSADERIKHVGIPKCSVKWEKDLRKPRTKPKILRSGFPQLATVSEPEKSPSKEKSSNDPPNFQDMAKFLMDSWKDEVGSEGQFDDVLSEQDYDKERKEVETKIDNPSRSDNSDRNNIDSVIEQQTEEYDNSDKNNIDSVIEQQAEEYFNRLQLEIDNEDLVDFENIEVSDSSNTGKMEKCEETELKARTKTLNGIWYSSDEIFVSNTGSINTNNSDFTDDTDLSLGTESLLPYDQTNNASSHTNSSCIGDKQVRNFDLTLPGVCSNESQGNASDNAASVSEPSHKHSTLSSSKTESESKRSSVTTDKDESIEDEWKTLSRKEKKKKRDAVRAKKFHEKYPEKDKQNTDTDSDSKPSAKKINSRLISKNTPQQHDISKTSWGLTGDSVIQIDGLPVDCDINILQDLIASYGTVKDSERKIGSHSSSIRFRLNDVDACEMVVSCLDDTDIFPGATNRITCVVVSDSGCVLNL